MCNNINNMCININEIYVCEMKMILLILILILLLMCND